MLTLDTPPHNELIHEGINGWILNCTYEKMEDNDDGLIMSAHFKIKDLANKILDIADNYDPTILTSLEEDYNNRFSINKFKKHFVAILG